MTDEDADTDKLPAMRLLFEVELTVGNFLLQCRVFRRTEVICHVRTRLFQSLFDVQPPPDLHWHEVSTVRWDVEAEDFIAEPLSKTFFDYDEPIIDELRQGVRSAMRRLVS